MRLPCQRCVVRKMSCTYPHPTTHLSPGQRHPRHTQQCHSPPATNSSPGSADDEAPADQEVPPDSDEVSLINGIEIGAYLASSPVPLYETLATIVAFKMSRSALDFCLRKVTSTGTTMARSGSTVFIHPQLTTALEGPASSCLYDAFAAVSAYTNRTKMNEDLVKRVVVGKTKELLRRPPWGFGEHLANAQGLLVLYIIMRFDGVDLASLSGSAEVNSRVKEESKEATSTKRQSWSSNTANNEDGSSNGNRYGSALDLSKAAESSFDAIRNRIMTLLQRSEDEIPTLTSPPSTSLSSSDQDHGKERWLRWLFLESVRRTYLSYIFVEALYANLRQGHCELVPLLATLPLAADGGLWSARDQEEWAALIKEQTLTRKILTGKPEERLTTSERFSDDMAAMDEESLWLDEQEKIEPAVLPYGEAVSMWQEQHLHYQTHGHIEKENGQSVRQLEGLQQMLRVACKGDAPLLPPIGDVGVGFDGNAFVGPMPLDVV
jgi:hypothetical protein